MVHHDIDPKARGPAHTLYCSWIKDTYTCKQVQRAMYARSTEGRFHGWLDGIPDSKTGHPVSSTGSRLHPQTIGHLILCNLYVHVAMTNETSPIRVPLAHKPTLHRRVGRYHGR